MAARPIVWVCLLACACSSNWTAPQEKYPTPRDVTSAGNAALCAGASRSSGSGYVAETCTSPVDAVVGVGRGSGYVWVAGPSEIIYR